MTLASLRSHYSNASIAFCYFFKSLDPPPFLHFSSSPSFLSSSMSALLLPFLFLSYFGSTLFRYRTSILRYGTFRPFAYLLSTSNTMSIWVFSQRTKQPLWFFFGFHLFWDMGFDSVMVLRWLIRIWKWDCAYFLSNLVMFIHYPHVDCFLIILLGFVVHWWFLISLLVWLYIDAVLFT